jgi:hypothetical protein
MLAKHKPLPQAARPAPVESQTAFVSAQSMNDEELINLAKDARTTGEVGGTRYMEDNYDNS